MSHYGYSTNRWTGGSGGNRGFGGNYDQGHSGGTSNRSFGGNYDQGHSGGTSNRGFGGNYDQGHSGGTSNKGFGGNYDQGHSGGTNNRGFGGNYDQGRSGGTSNRGFGGNYDQDHSGGTSNRGFVGNYDQGYGGGGSSKRGFNGNYSDECGRGFRSKFNEDFSALNDANYGGNNLAYGGKDQRCFNGGRDYGANYTSSFSHSRDKDRSSFSGDGGSDVKIKVEESDSSNKSFEECLDEGSIVEIKNEKGGRPKYQCLHCKITFFNEDHIKKGGHRGHVEHCVDVKACFEATVGKKGFGLDFKKVECNKSEDFKPIPVKTDPDEHKNVLGDLAPAHARKLIRFYIEAIDKNVEAGDPISILEVAEKSNTINKINILKDLFLELGDLCHLSTNPDGSVDLQVKKQIVKNSHIKMDSERVQKIKQFGLQSLNVALPMEREERLRWRIPGSWNVKPSELGEKWTPKHDSLLVTAKLEYGHNWTDLIKDKEFGLGQSILNEQGDVKDEVKSRQEYLISVVNFRGDYNEEDMKAGHKNLWRKNMDQEELKRANKRKLQSDSNQGSGHKKFYGGPSH